MFIETFGSPTRRPITNKRITPSMPIKPAENWTSSIVPSRDKYVPRNVVAIAKGITYDHNCSAGWRDTKAKDEQHSLGSSNLSAQKSNNREHKATTMNQRSPPVELSPRSYKTRSFFNSNLRKSKSESACHSPTQTDNNLLKVKPSFDFASTVKIFKKQTEWRWDNFTGPSPSRDSMRRNG